MSLPDDASPSTAAIAGHPLHPMLVPFPIAFLVATLVVDIVFNATHDPFWGRAAFWLLAAGIVMAAIAAVLGLIDFLTIRRVRSLPIAWVHFLGNGLAVLLAIWNIALRWSDPAAGPTGLAIALSVIVVAILLVTGWLGGELAYRHRIGVMKRESVPVGDRRP
ncbi:MAG TPA: DUF2231 domain-containing protein [Dongiaceae bacterium]